MGCGASSKKYESKDGKGAAGQETKTAEAEKPAAEVKKDGEKPAAPATETAKEAPKEATKEAAPPPAPEAAKVVAAPAPAEAAKAEAAPAPAEAAPVEDEEDEDDDADEMDEAEAEEMFKRGSVVMHRKREGVMAENYAPEEGWEPPKIEKSEAQHERLKAALARPAAFMFHQLEPTEVETLILAFKEHDLEPGAEVIKQGTRVLADDPGLYVIESGELDVFKTNDPESDPMGPNVFTYQGQGQFGELALLYNAPRAATVVAKTACVVWSIDRNTFNHCVKDATVRRAAKYEEFLGKVEILKDLAPDERSKIADVLKPKIVNEGDEIIKQGEKGDDFFIIEAGSAVATKDGEVVKEYGPTEYFGELALISSAERRATVKAKETPTKILSVDRAAFTRLLGSLEEKLKEKAKGYVGMEDEVL
mmetsp:Transcript_130555/g.226921  ORF Transcript_130555/g.226921 Transcript_130555/m.226921 type:complete len:421 (+) Transcript_130555:77-1339(+)